MSHTTMEYRAEINSLRDRVADYVATIERMEAERDDIVKWQVECAQRDMMVRAELERTRAALVEITKHGGMAAQIAKAAVREQ